MKINKMMIFGAIGLVVVAGGGFGAWRVLKARSAPPAEVKHKEEEVKATVGLTPVVVNVAGDGRRYVRLAVALGITDAKAVKAVEEAKSRLLDLVIDVAAGTDADTLTGEEGRTGIKTQLKERIHKELGLKGVAHIYLTEFVVQ